VSAIGLPGPALGTVAASALVIMPAFVLLGCAAARCTVASFLRGSVLPHVLPSVATTAALLALRHIAEQGRLQVIAVSAAAVGLYAAVYYLLCAAPDEVALVARLFGRPYTVGRHYRRR
jgi:hypothetical protein